MNRERREDAEAFELFDIFTVNTAMRKADPRHKAAWARCRAKLVESAQLIVTVEIPPEICDEHGDIIPGAVANPKR